MQFKEIDSNNVKSRAVALLFLTNINKVNF